MANLKFLASKEIYSFLASFPKVCVNAVMPLTNKTQHGTSCKPPDKELFWNLWERSFCEMRTQVKRNPKVIKQAGENEQLNFNFFGSCSLPLLVHSFRPFDEDSHYSTFFKICKRFPVNVQHKMWCKQYMQIEILNKSPQKTSTLCWRSLQLWHLLLFCTGFLKHSFCCISPSF